MKHEQPLSEYIGKNDKTKVIVKLQRSTAGPPLREGVMSQEQEKQMMLHMFRRNQEIQVLCNTPLLIISLQLFLACSSTCFSCRVSK